MKHGWVYKKLGEVVTSSDLGKTLNQSKDTGTMRPYLCAVNILWDKIDLTTLKETRFEESELERYTVSKGDLLICEGGDTGRAAIWDKTETILYQNALHRLRFKGQTDTRFVLFFLKYLKDTGELDHKYCKGVTIKHLVKSSLLSIPIPNPPLSVQKSIVSELDKINELIHLKKEQLSDYDKLAQSLFYEMFGVPGENEKGWEFDSLSNLCDVFAGGDKPSDLSNIQSKEFPYPVIANGNGNKGILGYSKNCKVKGNAVTIGARGSIGNCRLVRNGFTPAVRLITLVPQGKLNCYYLYYYVKNMNYRINGVAQAQLTVPNIKGEIIPIPPLSLQQLFASRITEIEALKSEIQRTINDLETLLASRMQYWFFGF